MNLLLAEDDAVARMTLSAVLKGLGYEVTEAEHGGDAWANLQLGHFPIVISDWQMPEVDGPELCRRLRARATDRYSYFLLITATGGKQRYLEGLLPMCAYCKRLRDASDKWEAIERYVEDRSEAQFSHGYCPACYEQHVRPQLEKP